MAGKRLRRLDAQEGRAKTQPTADLMILLRQLLCLNVCRSNALVGWLVGWMDGWMHGWMDGWMDLFDDGPESAA